MMNYNSSWNYSYNSAYQGNVQNLSYNRNIIPLHKIVVAADYLATEENLCQDQQNNDDPIKCFSVSNIEATAGPIGHENDILWEDASNDGWSVMSVSENEASQGLDTIGSSCVSLTEIDILEKIPNDFEVNSILDDMENFDLLKSKSEERHTLDKLTRAKDIPKCWHSNHIEGFVSRNNIVPSNITPIIRCVHSRNHEYNFPENLVQQFRYDFPKGSESYTKHTFALFLDMGYHDLIVTFIFAQHYSDDCNHKANSRRVFFECFNTLVATDVDKKLHSVANQVLQDALVGYLHLMGRCGFKTAHFRAIDEASQQWCLRLLERAKQMGCIMTLMNYAGKKEKKNYEIHNFTDWLNGIIICRRKLGKIPLFDNDKLPKVMDNIVARQLMIVGRSFHVDKFWTSLSHFLRKDNVENFIAALSHNTPFSSRCFCVEYRCDAAVECLLGQKRESSPPSIFDNSNILAEALSNSGIRFDSQASAIEATKWCIKAVSL